MTSFGQFLTELILKQVKGMGTIPFPTVAHHPATRAVIRKFRHFSQLKVPKTALSPWGQFLVVVPSLDPTTIRVYLHPSGGK